MKAKIKWIVLGLLFLVIFVLTFMKKPEEITRLLENVSREVKGLSAFVHLLFLAVLGLGILIEKVRNSLFSLFMAFLSLSATVVSVKYVIVPNIIIFGMFFVLVIQAYLTKKLTFDLKNIGSVNLFFGILGLVFGFWYLHWVESPVWLNAFVFSPLGAVNCPTMAALSGFLCLTQKPRSAVLETAVGLITLYFGFFGIFRLGAYVDVALILCGLFLIVRLSASLSYSPTFVERKL